MSLNDIAYEMGEGCFLGEMGNFKTDPVPDDKLKDECIALGNDGTFFDDPMGEADDTTQGA